MSHRHYSSSHRHGNFLLPLAALIALFLLIFGRRRGTRYAVLIILAVFIVFGVGFYNYYNN
jgi:O-antigen ligase